jgi:hypothetical protein
MCNLRKGLLKQIKEKFGFGSWLDKASGEINDAKAMNEIAKAIKEHINRTLERKHSLSVVQKSQIRESILDELFGYGPLGPILRHPHVANIYLEGLDRAYIEKRGPRGSQKLQKIKLPFDNEEHLLNIVQGICRQLGEELTSDSPVISAAVPNGVRTYATMAPATVHGTTLSVICPKLTTIEVVPHWQLSISHHELLHEAIVRRNLVADDEHYSLKITLKEPRTHAYLYQFFSARSLRSKKIIFRGTIQLEDEAEQANESSNSSQNADNCGSATEAAVWVCAWTRRKSRFESVWAEGDEPIAKTGVAVTLTDTKTQTFECSLEVPPQAEKISIRIYLQAPACALISDLAFETSPQTKLRASQGPKNLELQPSLFWS